MSMIRVEVEEVGIGEMFEFFSESERLERIRMSTVLRGEHELRRIWLREHPRRDFTV